MITYHFVTEWLFQSPPERLWAEFIDIESYPAWWQSFRKAKIRGSERTLQLGSVADCEVKGSAVYSLRIALEVIAFQAPRLLEMKSSGDLVGSGKWVLEPEAGGTKTVFYWDVGTTKWLFNFFGKLPFVKAWMEKNHNRVMANGYAVLRRKLEQ